MKYQRDDSFLADYLRLPERERDLFKEAVRKLNEADAQRTGWPPAWPSALRIKSVAGHLNIWEMTWSFAGPDGRATFEFVEVDGKPAVRWRRIGGHDISPAVGRRTLRVAPAPGFQRSGTTGRTGPTFGPAGAD